MKHRSLGPIALCLVTAAVHAQPRPAVQPQPRPVAQPQPQPRPPVRDRSSVVAPIPGSWAPTCTAQAGCVAPPSLPRCPSVITADIVPLRLGGDGGRVLATGRLHVSSTVCTTLACPAGQCCNACSATVTFESGGRAYELGLPAAPAVTCTGDDSGLCCSSPIPSGDVQVIGTLRFARARGGATRIESPSLCQP